MSNNSATIRQPLPRPQPNERRPENLFGDLIKETINGVLDASLARESIERLSNQYSQQYGNPAQFTSILCKISSQGKDVDEWTCAILQICKAYSGRFGNPSRMLDGLGKTVDACADFNKFESALELVADCIEKGRNPIRYIDEVNRMVESCPGQRHMELAKQLILDHYKNGMDLDTFVIYGVPSIISKYNTEVDAAFALEIYNVMKNKGLDGLSFLSGQLHTILEIAPEKKAGMMLELRKLITEYTTLNKLEHDIDTLSYLAKKDTDLALEFQAFKSIGMEFGTLGQSEIDAIISKHGSLGNFRAKLGECNGTKTQTNEPLRGKETPAPEKLANEPVPQEQADAEQETPTPVPAPTAKEDVFDRLAASRTGNWIFNFMAGATKLAQWTSSILFRARKTRSEAENAEANAPVGEAICVLNPTLRIGGKTYHLLCDYGDSVMRKAAGTFLAKHGIDEKYATDCFGDAQGALPRYGKKYDEVLINGGAIIFYMDLRMTERAIYTDVTPRPLVHFQRDEMVYFATHEHELNGRMDVPGFGAEEIRQAVAEMKASGEPGRMLNGEYILIMSKKLFRTEPHVYRVCGFRGGVQEEKPLQRRRTARPMRAPGRLSETPEGQAIAERLASFRTTKTE